MQYEFLKQFPKRMKHVGMYALVLQNSSQKQTWKQYGFLKTDEQINIIFALMLYIMEQSLKEEKCTMDDMGAYLDYLNMTYFNTEMSFDDCRKLGDFIINVILSNEGKAMYFDGYDFEQRAYKIMNISYVSNEIVYLDSDVKRTSYRLTEDGYNLLLSTLEIENNMKLTIHEMIFKMHLEKQSYDKAVDEIKNVFNLLRIQLQKIQDAMLRVRRNALSYSVSDYEQLLGENMESIDMTKQKFQSYRETVRKRAKELEEQNINVRKLSAQEEENLENLRIIESYLNRGIDEHQKILNSHFDLKILYEKELELLSQMSLIQRFSLRTDLYDKVLLDASGLDNIDIFLRPLFHQAPDKIYNLQKATQLQRPIRKKQQEEEEEVLDRVCRTRFRSAGDVNQYVMKYWQYMEGKYEPQSPKIGKFFTIGLHDRQIHDVLRNQKCKILCINDTENIGDFRQQKRNIKDSFESILPEKSAFELSYKDSGGMYDKKCD